MNGTEKTRSTIILFPRLKVSLGFWVPVVVRLALSASNLSLGKRRHPRKEQVESNDHSAHDVEAFMVVGALKSEQDGKDDASKVTHRTNRATQDTIGMRVYVRHKSKVSSITSLEEKCHARNQAEHHRFLVRIGETNGDEESS